MNELINYLKEHKACGKLTARNFDELSRQMFEEVGIEFLKNARLPKEIFQKYKIKGVHVDGSVEIENEDVLLVNSKAHIEINNLDKVYKIVLLHGSSAKIVASNYAVIKIHNISGEYELIKDETVKDL